MADRHDAKTVTRLLHAAARGEAGAADDLLRVVYDELHDLARARLARAPAQTLQPTELLDEVYARLVLADDDPDWSGRNHFYFAAARAMRDVLVERARRNGRLKRGGGRRRVDLEGLALPAEAPPDDLLALDECLDELGRWDERAHRVVMLRFFAGLTLEQVADHHEERLAVVPRVAGQKTDRIGIGGSKRVDEALLRKAKAVFLEAVERPADERDRFVDARCGSDASLRREVEGLLEGDRGATPGFLSGAGECRANERDPDHDQSDGMTGRRVGGFALERLIASGGMGRVYVATQDRPRRSVAVKLMRPGVASRSSLRRFELESQVLGRLRHPNIAQVYEAGTYDDGAGGAPYFAMEYVPDARSITAYATAAALGTRERLALFSKVCDAVHHGHEHGIVHRDLKPSNLLIDAAGEPKIIDFGVAKATDSDLALTSLETHAGELIGTLQYMSPEQCAADVDDLDARSDTYALGVVLYELLCGGLPYDVSGAPLPEAARMIQEEEPTKPSIVNRALRGDVETIALKALEKDRTRRYQSVAELAEDIGRYLRGEAIEARPPSVLYRAQALRRRHRVASAVAAILLVAGPLLIVTTVVAVRSAARAQALDDLVPTDPRTVSPRARGRSWSGFEREVDEMVIAFMRVRGIPGATVAVSKDGRLVHAKGYGLADVGRGIPMEPWHRTRIGAVGNALLITPALLKVLESTGGMDLDTPLYGPGGIFETEPFLDDIEIGTGRLAAAERERQLAWYRAMTARHVVTEMSGLATPKVYAATHKPGVAFRDVHRKILRTRALQHEPGRAITRTAPQVAGLAIAVLSGKSQVTYVEEHLLEPVGLRGIVVPDGTVVDERDALPHRDADGTGRQRLEALEITKVTGPRPYVEGGWVASARDLVRLMVAMDGLEAPAEVLSPAAFAETRRLAPVVPKRIAAEWLKSDVYRRTTAFWARTNARGHSKYLRPGVRLGGGSFVVMFPEGYVTDSGTDLSQVTVALCTNKRHSSLARDQAALADRLATVVGEASVPASFDLWGEDALSPPPTP
jgi:RNA polymerase sigma factor (TIGR02999 family)